MPDPKRIEDITLDDLTRHRWCYFHDDEEGYDSFDWVIPDTHPRFSTEVTEVELATFRFHGGQEFLGMFDGYLQFSVCLEGEWHSFWTGVAKPTEQKSARLAEVLTQLGLALPVVTTAKWSRQSARYHGIRYIDEQGNTVEST